MTEQDYIEDLLGRGPGDPDVNGYPGEAECQVSTCCEGATYRQLRGEKGVYHGYLCDKHFDFAKAFGMETGRKVVFLA